MSLKLKIVLSKETTLELTNNGTESTFDNGNTKYSVTLKNIEFHKKMYAPGEIIADLQISGTTTTGGQTQNVTMSCSDLDTLFKKKEVTLAEGSDNTVAKNYYVHEIVPRREKGSDSRFATLKIYSPDKLWTLDKYSRSYVAKRLYNDILLDTTITSNNRGMATMFTIPYSSSKLSTLLNVQTLNTLGTKSNEYILPYLVQYNETFYDLLVRTANRWGEFVYFEDGSLNIGYKDNTATELTNYKSFSEFSRAQGSPLTINMSSHNVTNPSTLSTSTADGKVVERVVDEVTTDEYLSAIENKDNFYDQVAGEISNFDLRYIWKKLGHLFLKNGNLYSFLLSFLTEDVLSLLRANEVHDQKEDKYKDNYFSKDDTFGTGDLSGKMLLKSQYEFSSTSSSDKPSKASKLYQFASKETGDSSTGKGPTAANYQTVLANEIEAGKNLICVDLGPDYANRLLGDIFYLNGDNTAQYMIIEVHCVTENSTKNTLSLNKATNKVVVKDKDGYNVEIELIDKDKLDVSMKSEPTSALHYKIIAVKKTNKGWYPPIHENGHVRTSGPQLAYVVDNDDPTRNMRYRVKYAWQTSDITNDLASPWLAVANPMATKDGGAFFKYQKDDQVLLNYEAGNIERPYIVGALQNQANTVAPESRVGLQTLITPGGQTLRMSDGVGNGLFAFMGSLVPIIKVIAGFCPSIKAEETKSYEGSIELTDKYGTYSIKASTDDRNVTVKSVFGDVTINAFTGITVSAPNGDVKIQGKNVTIEAGNNLTLKSGTNIKNGFLGNVHNDKSKWAESMATDAAQALMQKTVSFIDLSALRCTWETVLKPIEGTLEIKSNRFLKLEAGKGSACYPDTALSKEAFNKDTADHVHKYGRPFKGIAQTIVTNFLTRRNTCLEKYNAYSNDIAGYENDCIKPKELLAFLWGKGADYDVKKEDLKFDNNLKPENSDNLADDNPDKQARVNKKAALQLAAQELNTAIKALKAIKKNDGKLDAVALNGNAIGVDGDHLKESFETANHLAFFQLPADNAGGDDLYNYISQDNHVNNNQTLIKKLAASTAIQYINSEPNDSLKLKAKATAPAPDFNAADWEEKWKNYVEGLSYNDQELSLADKLKDQMTDMTIDKTAFFSNTMDHKVWGGDNNASILMSNGNKTYMLDDNGGMMETHGLNKMKPYYAMSVSPNSDYALALIKQKLRSI